jgi:hypothetical protein
VIEWPDELLRSVGQLHGEGAVARIQSLCKGAERAVGIGVLLEDAPNDLVGDAAGA